MAPSEIPDAEALTAPLSPQPSSPVRGPTAPAPPCTGLARLHPNFLMRTLEPEASFRDGGPAPRAQTQGPTRGWAQSSAQGHGEPCPSPHPAVPSPAPCPPCPRVPGLGGRPCEPSFPVAFACPIVYFTYFSFFNCFPFLFIFFLFLFFFLVPSFLEGSPEGGLCPAEAAGSAPHHTVHPRPARLPQASAPPGPPVVPPDTGPGAGTCGPWPPESSAAGGSRRPRSGTGCRWRPAPAPSPPPAAAAGPPPSRAPAPAGSAAAASPSPSPLAARTASQFPGKIEKRIYFRKSTSETSVYSKKQPGPRR